MKLFLLLFVLALHFSLQAQADWKCATPKAHWPKSGFPTGLAPTHFRSDSTILYIPITLNFVGTDEGTGYYEYVKMMEALCALQADFDLSYLQFYIGGPPHYLNHSAFFDMTPEYLLSNEMFAFIETHNTQNTMNVYCVKDAEGASLVSFRDFDYDNSTYPPTINNPQNQAIIIDEDYLASLAKGFAHEVGHYFTLWHTFNGWEGYNYIDYAGAVPDTLYWTAYDPVEDTSYVLPWLVEYADESNCLVSGDLICDTPPDYLSIGFMCNANQESNIVQADPNGNMFRSDGSNYMSYSNSSCRDMFTQGQRTWMRDVAQGPRSYLLYDQSEPEPYSADSVNFIYPVNQSTIEVLDSVTLEWNVPGADYYVLEFGRKVTTSFFLPIIKDKVLEQLSFKVAVGDEFNYYWKVSAINKHDFCHVVNDTSFFTTTPLSGSTELGKPNSLLLYPNPVTGYLYWQIPEIASNQSHMNLQLFDAKGKLINEIFNLENKNIHTGDLPRGMYIIKLMSEDQLYVGKFVKQ
jgi:hypothetical protein